MGHALGLGLQGGGNQRVPLGLVVLRFAAAAALNLPDRINAGFAHPSPPQGGGMAVDPIRGGDLQVLLSGPGGQNQPAAQGHLLGRSMRRLPLEELGSICRRQVHG